MSRSSGCEDHDGIHPIQRPALPLPDLVQHGIGDAADQVGRDLLAIKIKQMSLDVPDSQAGGIETDDPVVDPVVDPVNPGLALLYKLRLEAGGIEEPLIDVLGR
ncbi:hypothetical protein H845_3697 (plasmid) [Komagataeibacter xylinus E25]|nr:hypothetical protein H845_3697 [Komagataeibacter xylinus E25]RFO99957.1 hypothetical protein BFX83_11080 [Komagataeibacter xylinus]